MELIGCYHAGPYTVEVYFPESGSEMFSIWVLRDGEVIAEFTERVSVESAYGTDAWTLPQLEAIAEAAVMEVMRKEAQLFEAA
jgi:hypothetical protein